MNNLKKLNRGGKSIGLLLFLFLMLGNIGAWAQDIEVAKLDFTTKKKNNSGYTNTWQYDNWTLYGANNNGWAYARFGGGKNNSSGTATITSPKVTDAVNYIEINHNGKSSDIYSISTIILETSENSDFSSISSTTTVENPDITKGTEQKTLTININKQIPANNYYRIKINWATSKTGSNAGLDIYSVVLKKSVSSNPAINAKDVTYAADVTKGEFTYTISNPNGSTLTAATTTSWIPKVEVVDDMVTFDMEENTATEPREGVIELTYGTLTKEVKVTQLAAVAKRTVTIEKPENGTLQILRDGEEVVSGSQVPEGTVLTAVVTPNEGYKYRNWQAVDFVNDEKTTHTYTTSFTYTVGGSDVTFKANFDPIEYTTITWSVNGVTTTTTVEKGTDITFTAPTTIPEGYVFTGWYGDKYENATTAPEEYVTSATAENDVTYYAVFAKSEGKEETATLTATHTKNVTDYLNHTYTDDKNNTWTSNSAEPYANNTARFGINKTSGHYFKSPTFSGNVTNIEMEVYNGSSSSNRTFYFDSQQTTKNGDLGTIAVAKGEQFVVKTATLTGDFNQFYINASDALGFTYIKVTYGNVTYSDFRTSVSVTPTTATISISSACTDGSLCYGTFSSTKPFVVPGDVKVSEINITEEGELLVESYDPGAVVPANTGVMVSALTGDNYEVELTDEAGTSVLGDRNMLRPTGAGITADQMATADPNCLYYRLTMHQGETLGFFWGAADGAAFNVAAGKAYLAVPVTQAARVNGFVLGGGTSTGIDSIADSMAAQRTVYNLQGQRVSGRLAKGVYIVNGKKVIIK